jgi:hypothetical protein
MDKLRSRVEGAASIADFSETFPALGHRKQRPLGAGVELARRELWRAFRRGALTEDELARTLDRLEFDPAQHLT